MSEPTGAPAPADTAPVPQPETTPTPEAEPAKDRTEVRQPPHKEKVEKLISDFETRQAALKEQRAKEKAKPPADPEKLRKGESWDDIYKRASPEQQRAMSSLRASTTRKQQELAREKRAQAAAKDALLTEDSLQRLQQTGRLPDDFDIYNPEHFNRLVEAKVAQALEKVIAPAQKAQKQAKAKASFEQFRADHPDLLDDPAVKQGVSKLLKANKTINVENAYWVVKGQIGAKEQVAQAQVQQVRRDSKRAAAQMVGLGVRPRGFRASTDEDRQGSAYDIFMRQKALHNAGR